MLFVVEGTLVPSHNYRLKQITLSNQIFNQAYQNEYGHYDLVEHLPIIDE